MQIKRNFSFIIALLLITSMLAACGTSKGKTTEATTKAPAVSTSEVNWQEPYSEPVTVTIVNEEIPTAKFPEGEDYYNNLWTKAWKKKFNIDVKTLWISSEYDTKLNLAIAAKDLPDIFRCNNVQFNQLVEAGMLQDLTDVYDKYASPAIRKMMEQDDPDVFATTHKDGKLLGIPRMHYGYECMTYFMWIKKNWMQEAGTPEIKTLDQFENLMKTFKEKYGAKYAMPLSKGLEQFYFMAPTWHAYPKIWLDDGTGKIVYGSTLPEMKNMLAKWAEWYKNGILRPDFTTLDFNTMEADVLNGIVGVEPGENWYSWVIADTLKNTGDGTWLEAYDLPSVDSEPVKYPIPFPNNANMVVSKQCKNPEVLIKLINDYSYILNEAVATGGMTMDEVLPYSLNNMHHVTGPFKVEFRSYGDVKEVVAAVKAGEKKPKFSSGYAYNYFNEIMKWYDSKDPTALGRTLQMGQERSSLNLAVGYVDRDLLVKSKMWGATPQALLDYGTNLEELLNQGFTKIITGAEPIDYFEKLIEEWMVAGGNDAAAAVNKMYGKK
jgi:putative aldouronate transport system substrate-binding protein